MKNTLLVELCKQEFLLVLIIKKVIRRVLMLCYCTGGGCDTF